MGLDNIPQVYPCKKQGFIEDGEQIDCSVLQENGQCPWKNEFESSLTKEGGGSPTYGMFGTDCWYRGKWGNYLIEELLSCDSSVEEPPVTLYGTGIHGEEILSSEDSTRLANWVLNHSDNFERMISVRDDMQSDMPDWFYLAWWLKFTAEFSDGSIPWY